MQHCRLELSRNRMRGCLATPFSSEAQFANVQKQERASERMPSSLLRALAKRVGRRE